MAFKTLKSSFLSMGALLSRGHPWRIAAEIGLLLCLIFCTEVSGRFAKTDLHDLMIAMVLLPFVLAGLYLHRKKGTLVFSRLDKIFSKGLHRLKRFIQTEVGADFRCHKKEEPPPSAYVDLKKFLAAALILAAAVIPFHPWLPGALRGIKEYFLYTPYLLLTTAIWTTLFGLVLLDLAILWILFNHYVLKSPFFNPKSFPGRPALWKRIYPRRFFSLMLLLSLLTCLELYFGKAGWFWFMAGTAVITLLLAYLPRPNEKVGLLIRRPATGTLHAISISEWNFSFYTVLQTVALAVFVLATGAGWQNTGPPESMPCTYYLGRVFGICTPVATLFYLFATLHFLDLKRIQCDPALGRDKTLYYRKGALPVDLKIDRWRLIPTEQRPSIDLGDLYYDPGRVEAEQEESGAPLYRKNILSIPPGRRSFALDHADFIAKRRVFYRGLKRLMKICHASTFRDGAGYILIPHCYFVEGLHRDDRTENLEEDRVIGPGFQVLWGLRVRRFLYRVLEAMDVDIIYFEDGIQFQSLKAVFEILFEFYHNRGPRFRIEDYHFTGLTGIRVFVEMIRPDQHRPEKEGYPETHFSNLSQARILMVFKDRGGGWSTSPDRKPGVDVDVPAFY
jgi:hypothetical protein